MVEVWRVLLRFVALAQLMMISSSAGWAQVVPAPNAVPQGGQVSAGSAAIHQSGTVTNPQLTITQQSDRAVINWQSFNLGRDATMQFQQPSASSVTLNRVLGSDPSSIFGKISSNGQIYVVEQPIGLTGFITPKALTVTGSTVSDRIYDGTTAIASTAGTLSGFVGSETVTATSSATSASKNVGIQTATLVYSLANGTNGGLASNYSLANTTKSVTISVKDLTVVGTKVETKVFDGKTDAKVSGGTLVGVVGGDQITLLESGAFASSNVGLSVPVVMNDQILGTFVGNYRLLQPQGVTGTINANTPILYPSPSGAAAPPPATQAPVATVAAGGWTVETNAAPTNSPAQSSGSAATPNAPSASTPALAIKVSADASQIHAVPDILNVGRVVSIDASGSNPTITSASISFVKGFDPGKTILELNQSGSVQINVDNATGKITLTGPATVAEYNRIIQSIRMKLNGASQQRVVSMNVGLVDQTGKRDTRTITLKPNDVQANVEFKIPTLPTSSNQQSAQQTNTPLNQQANPQAPEIRRAFAIPSLPAAPLLQNNKPSPERQGALPVPVSPVTPLQPSNKPILERQGAISNPSLAPNPKRQTAAINEIRTETTNTFDKITQAANDNTVARYSSFVR